MTETVNTPSASADGFSVKLCGNPLAWRPKARSMPESPEMNDLSRSHVSVESAAAFAAVHPFRKRLGFDRATFTALCSKRTKAGGGAMTTPLDEATHRVSVGSGERLPTLMGGVCAEFSNTSGLLQYQHHGTCGPSFSGLARFYSGEPL